MPSILIIEDEAATAAALKDLLTHNGYQVSVTPHAEGALQKISASPPDLLILDIGLPGLSGMRLCEILKGDPRTAVLPIIMLTSKSREAEKVEGLKAGADDYVVKPFSAKELIARIEALLRRVERQGLPARVLEAGAIRVDLDAHEVTVKGKSVSLRPKEYALLVLFLGKKNRVLTYSFLAEAVWGDDRIATAKDVMWWVHQLRETLGSLGSRIETITGSGYKFIDE